MNTINKFFLIGILLLIGVLIGIGSHLLINKLSNKNVITYKWTYWSNEWNKITKDNQTIMETTYPGSEFSFAFTGSRSITFRVNAEEKKEQVELVIFIDGKEYLLSNPNINDKRLEIVIPEEAQNKKHTVRGVFYCMPGLAKCKIQMTEINLEDGEMLPWDEGRRQKTIGVLGDSISLIGLKDNYSTLLAKSLGMHVHNASYWGRTIGREKGVNPAILQYKRDLKKYKPDIVLVFMGLNDVYYLSPIDSFEKDYSALIAGIKKELPNSKIVTVGILPGKEYNEFSQAISDYNDVIKSTAEKYNVSYLDSTSWLTAEDYSDQIHPNARGEQKIGDNLYTLFKKNNIVQ